MPMDQFTLSIEPEDHKRLKLIAEKHGLKAAQVIRIMLEQRLKITGWKLYDEAMMGRISLISAMSPVSLQKLDRFLIQLVSEDTSSGWSQSQLDNITHRNTSNCR